VTVDIAVTNETELNQAIAQAEGQAANSGAFAIHFTATITLAGPLRTIDLTGGTTLTIDGGGLTIDGQSAERGSIDCRGSPEVWPVRVTAHAFGAGMPRRDLVLSPDHAVFVDGVLVPVRYLVNGGSVAREARDEVTYWHVELSGHEAIVAEGLACESYLDVGDRGNFGGGGGAVVVAHPRFAAHVREARGRAPVVVAGPEVEGVRRRLRERVALVRVGIG
jgi:collagen type I/II/III/V/XI/XXIV/XXVII alpha